MNSIFLCVAVAILFGAGGCLLDWWGWGWAILFTILVFVGCSIVLARLLGKRLQPAMQRVQNQMQSGMLEAATQGLRDLLPMSRWVPMLRGQLLAQMGALAYHGGKQKEAIELLSQSSPRVGDAQMLLASILYRNGEKPRALQVLALATRFDKRHRLLHNVHAWMLHKESRDDDAIAVLARYLKKQATDEASKDNMLRLQNRKRMTMEPFGMPWYALQLERPPAEFGELRTARKGFRTPPKRRG